MPRRDRACGGIDVMSEPSNSIRPVVGAASPVIRLNRVVLPAPLGPITASASPPSDGEVHVIHGFERAVMLRYRLKLKEDWHERLFSCGRRAVHATAVLVFTRALYFGCNRIRNTKSL